MRTLQEHYNAIKNGKGNKAQFLKQAKHLFPQYINQYSDFDTATHVLKSKQIISENVGGVVSKGFDIWDWKKILAEEAKAEEKKVTKEVEDYNKSNFDNKDMKNADNINFNEIMKGFYAELRDEKNNGKTGDEIKAMVVKNLAKDPLYYTKSGEFGVKDLGYTDEAPGLGVPKEPKGKYKSSGYGDLSTEEKVEKVKANVQDSLGDKEAKTSMPKKVKEMSVTPQNSKGVKKMPMPGKEKKIKLKENLSPDQLAKYDKMSDQEIAQWAEENGMEDLIVLDYEGGLANREEVLAALLGKEVDDNIDRDEEDMWGPDDIDPAGGHGPSSHMESKLRSAIRQIIREELSENESSIKKGDTFYHKNSEATLEVIDVKPKTITMKVTKISDKTPAYVKVGQKSKTSPANIGKTYIKK